MSLKYSQQHLFIQIQTILLEQKQMNSQNICDCHCGTRIDLDEQLLQQRQMWKQKYNCLQQQLKVDIEVLKQNIYAECAGIMQQQFTKKEQQHNKFVNQKNVEVKDLIAKIINLETQVKILTKEKEIGELKVRDLEAELAEKEGVINGLRSKSSKSIRDWELKHQEEIVGLKQRLTMQAKESVDKIQAQRQLLKQKLKQFQQKYQKLLPQIQKMRTALTTKSTQNEQLISTIQKLKKKQEEDHQHHRTKYQDLERIHNTCSKQIKDLSDRNQDLRREVEKGKKLSRDVKVQPVYIDRPVEVQKIVEKIVQVEKLVNKYVDNPVNQKKMKMLDQENSRLKDQLNNVLKEIKQLEEHFRSSVIDFEDTIKEHQKNAVLYKKQRQNLAAKIGEQNKQLEMLHNFIDKLGAEKSTKSQPDNEKIVVHVKQDGTYQKTVQKLPPAPTSSNTRKKK